MYVMPFGAHKGEFIKDIPASYLIWISTEDYCPDPIAAYVDLNDELLHDAAQEEAAYNDIGIEDTY